MIQNLRKTTLFSSDALALISAATLSYAMIGGDLSQSLPDDLNRMVWIHIILAFSCSLYLMNKGHYKWRNPWWQQVRQTVRTCATFLMISLLINYAALPHVNAQYWLFSTWLLSSVFILSFRWGGRYILKRLNHWDIPTFLVGGHENITETVYALKSEPYLTYDIKCVQIIGEKREDIENFRILHPELNIVEKIDEIPSRTMVILCPEHSDSEFLRIFIERIIKAGARFAVVPPTHGLSLYGLQTQYFFGHKIVLLESHMRIRTFLGSMAKGLLDKVGAIFGLVLFSPVLLFCFIKIRKDGGPAFYYQMRIGKAGKKFKCWKLRSMIVNAEKVLEEYLATNPQAREEYSKDFKLRNDPRITKIGHLIRKTSIDELPQLYNVLRGEMSLVGPRPIVDAEVSYYGENYNHYLSVRPGITGMWQVSGRNDVTYAERVSLDVWYVDNWTVWNDVVIILKTLHVILSRKGAY